MNVYLDNCSLQRPLDDLSQERIRREAEAILQVLDFVKTGHITLVSSDVLIYEIERTSQQTRLEYALETVVGAPLFIRLTEEIIGRSEQLNQIGIKTLDSMHLASAEAGEVDYFCTCDDTFLKKARREGRVRVVSPLELAEELERWHNQQDR